MFSITHCVSGLTGRDHGREEEEVKGIMEDDSQTTSLSRGVGGGSIY